MHQSSQWNKDLERKGVTHSACWSIGSCREARCRYHQAATRCATLGDSMHLEGGIGYTNIKYSWAALIYYVSLLNFPQKVERFSSNKMQNIRIEIGGRQRRHRRHARHARPQNAGWQEALMLVLAQAAWNAFVVWYNGNRNEQHDHVPNPRQDQQQQAQENAQRQQHNAQEARNVREQHETFSNDHTSGRRSHVRAVFSLCVYNSSSCFVGRARVCQWLRSVYSL